MTDQPTCETCKWWDHAIVSCGATTCSRFPPTVVVDSSGPRTAWPETRAGNSCGEHSPRSSGSESGGDA